jgi:hypothetical protein
LSGDHRFNHHTSPLAGETVHSDPSASPVPSGATPRTSQSALEFARRPQDFPVRQSLRVVQFANGDRITAELREASRDAAELRLFGSVRWRIPMIAVAGISLRPNERPLPASSHSDEAGSSQNSPRRWDIPAYGGDVTCRFGGEFSEVSRSPPFAWIADFAGGGRITISADVLGRWHARQLPSSRTAVLQAAAAPERHRADFRLQTVGDHIYVSLNGRLLLSDGRPDGALQSLEWAPTTSAGGENDAEPSVASAYAFVVAVRSANEEFPKPMKNVDAIVSADGDVWWGDFNSLSSQTVSWLAGGKKWNRDWTNVSGVIFRAAPTPISLSLTGRVVRVELQPLADRLDLPGDRLTGALGGVSEGWLHLEHALAGRLAIPLQAVRRVESVHLGEYRVLAVGETVDGLLAEHAGNFPLSRVPESAVTISVEVSGLEPSGPRTPPGSPRLKSLRQGMGTTEVYVNERGIGVLNELTSRWTLPGEFETLRLPVPREWLRPGKNTWSIRSAEGGKSTNESRLRAIALELPPEIPQDVVELLR